MQVLPYVDAAEWDAMVARCPMATFLHTRRYLSYHEDRFEDASVVLIDDNQKALALFPAAVDPTEPTRIVSHPGITFGGFLHEGALVGEEMLAALTAIRDHSAGKGFKSLRYKVVPHIYHQSPSQDDVYALFRLGARRYRCDLSCAIDLQRRLPASQRRLRGQRKAAKSGVEIIEGADRLEEFWQVLTQNLQTKYNQKPTHTVAEIMALHSLFPQNIQFTMGQVGSEIVAGVVLFVTPRVMHAQYIAANEAGQKTGALDGIFEHCIQKAGAGQFRYFDFGISTESDGQYLNGGLYQFKAQFGGGGVVHDFFELDLSVSS